MISFGFLPPLCAARLNACLQSSQAHIKENFGEGYLILNYMHRSDMK